MIEFHRFRTPRPSGTESTSPGLVRRFTLVGLMTVGFVAGLGVDRLGIDGFGDRDGAGASSSITDVPEFAALQQSWDLIHDNYVDEGAIDDQALLYGAAKGMVDALGDTGHSTFLTPSEAEAFEAASKGEIIGIGVQLDFETGRPVIVSPIDGSPADVAGLRRGDVITAVDGVSTEGLSTGEISSMLRGEEGTPVSLQIERQGESQPFNVDLTRAKITLEPVSWSMLDGNIAHVRLSEFTVGATKDLTQALKDAKAAGATAIIFDIRDNPGGLVFEAIGVASQFLPEGKTIYQYQERGSDPNSVKSVGIGAATDIPMVVLINGGSASSSEIIAGALSENGRATLYGERTYGTGTVLVPFELDDGSSLVLGTAFWLSPSGQSFWHVGVQPDVPVNLDLSVSGLRPDDSGGMDAQEIETTGDTQLLAAYQSLTLNLEATPASE